MRTLIAAALLAAVPFTAAAADGVSYTYNEATVLNPVSEPFPIGEGIDASWGLVACGIMRVM